MTNKHALISGGTRGIGLAIAQMLAQQGFNVATFARTQSELDTFAGKMAEYNVQILTLQGDAHDDEFLQQTVAETVQKFGGLSTLINNAGGGKKGTVAECSLSDWDQILDVNLRAAMVLTKICLPHIIKATPSAIINIASIAGKTGFAGSSAYCASKFGLVGFTQSLFEEIREHGTKVCAICPGYVDTALIPQRKALRREEMIQASDVAQAVAFVLAMSASACPTEIIIRPQRDPFRK